MYHYLYNISKIYKYDIEIVIKRFILTKNEQCLQFKNLLFINLKIMYK